MLIIYRHLTTGEYSHITGTSKVHGGGMYSLCFRCGLSSHQKPRSHYGFGHLKSICMKNQQEDSRQDEHLNICIQQTLGWPALHGTDFRIFIPLLIWTKCPKTLKMSGIIWFWKHKLSNPCNNILYCIL